ncbi:MAG: IclR family transcriptional regulator [Actinomycetota bacterium]|nr:IclR family transcriptional regulator [Actinomycetota bacterium]
MGHTSAIGVLDKAVLVLRQAALSPVTLVELVERVDLPRATAHRIAVALERHGLLRRNDAGAWTAGPLLKELANGAFPDLAVRAGPILEQLSRDTGESAQLFEREDDVRVCTAMAERPSGLRDTVPLGARLPMTAGSAAHVLLAWSTRQGDEAVVADASFPARTLAEVRRRGYAHSSAEREAGVASVSAPVREADGRVIAAVSVSGPLERLGRRPQASLVSAVLAAAQALSAGPATGTGLSPSDGSRELIQPTGRPGAPDAG